MLLGLLVFHAQEIILHSVFLGLRYLDLLEEGFRAVVVADVLLVNPTELLFEGGELEVVIELSVCRSGLELI